MKAFPILGILVLLDPPSLASPLFKGVPLAEWGQEVERAPAMSLQDLNLGIRVLGVFQFSELMTLVNLIRAKMPESASEWIPESLSRGTAAFRIPTSVEMKTVLERIQGLETPLGKIQVRADEIDRTIQIEVEGQP